MDRYEIKCDSKKSVKFPDKVSAHVASPSKNAHVNKIGGIIKKGQWAWLAKGSTIQIVSLKNGHTMSTFEFAESNGYDNCVIKCADELFPHNVESVYLAICLECMNSTGGSFIAIYSVDHSTVLSCMEVKLRVTSCRFMESTVCKRSLLQNFDGCLAIGSMEGALVLLDLNIRKMLALHEHQIVEDVFIPCHVVEYNMPLREIHRNFKRCKQDGVHFGLQMEVIDAPCSVQCLLPIDLIMALAVGYEDGRLALYDLTELQIFYIAMPQQQEATTPLVKMDFLEPPDDPRPCLYIWALHENEDSLTAVLHSLMYEKRFIDNDESGFCFFETFQSSNVRLMLPLDNCRSIAISCQAIKKSATHDADDSSCLCALSWYAESEEINKLLIFDLNQWYKEEMPFMLDADKKANFLASYTLSGSQCALQSYINPSTIAYFNSLQRFEEHFYPSSLSFDCTLLTQDSCLSFNWEGAQNRFISTLRSSNATIFLDPNTYFTEIIHTRLMPQFCELNAKATFSTNAKYEIILSVALEHNCFSLLRDCAKCWVDGSFTGTFSTTTGITLSTLTNWIWKRATDIKTRCNDLCKGLFDFDGYPLDQRELKEFGFISRQLKLLSDLLDEVLTFSKLNVPEKVFSNLEHKYKSLRMATDYQDILMWLLNIGLLPEASPYSCKMNSSTELVPYPYRFLKELYAKKRAFFGKICENFVSKKTGSCRLIYIDAYIQHECKGSVLREYWLENNGDGLYPPTSIESMLRIMLVPDVSFESKCAILLYFFLDLNMAINDDAYKHVVANFIKFPSVFKLSASLIKTVQAFWNLDHGHFLPAVDEFISPFNKNQKYPEWVLELLIEALLMQDSSNLTLRILEAHSTLISPVLKLQALLANELISEAFHFARSKQNDTLLEQFFESCLCDGKFGVIRDLALSEKEDQLVQDILKRSKTQNAENLHFVYLLQKSKYIEAVSYMEEISKAKCMRSNLNNTAINTPNLVLSAYNTTMTPVTQGLTDVYFRIKNKIRKKETDNKSPVPLSCQLIKQNANNLLGGIYHSSALSAHFATYYWGEIDNGGKKDEVDNNLLNSNNAPFLRKPQVETNYLDFQEKGNICFPQPYRVNAKRTLAESELQDLEKPILQENPKKRRKLTGNEIIKDLSNFVQMNKHAGYLSNTDFKLSASADIQASTTQSTENFFIQPPVLKTSQPQDELVAKNTSLEALISMELHGILKTNTPEPMERHGIRKELPLEEEKIIRFKLPATDLTGEDSSETEEVVKEVETKQNEKDKASVTHEDISPAVKRKRIVTRSMSTESNESNSSTARAMSDDNFYSPLSSRNNSLVVESKSYEANTSALSNTSTVSNTRIELNDGPKPRKPLNSVSTERSLEKFKNALATDKVESTGLQLTAMDRKTNSDFEGSFSVKDSNISNKHTTLVISSVTSLVSNVREFIPPISSSKVCETQSKFTLDKVETQQKISDYSTIIGGVTYMETTVDTSNKTVGSERTDHNKDKKLLTEELDTTLGMTSYDISVFEATSVRTNKSLLQQSNEGVAEVITKSVNSTPIITNIYEDLESETKTETEDSNSLFDESLGLEAEFSPQNSSSSDKQQMPNSVRKKNEDDAIIVLSSEDEQGESIESASVEESIEEDANDEDVLEHSFETEQTENSLDEEEDTIEDDDDLTVDEESLEGTAESADDGDNLDYQEDDEENNSHGDDITAEERQEKRDTDEDSEDVQLKNIDDMELYAEELEPQYQDSESSILVENLNDDEKQSSVSQDEEDTCLHGDSDSSTDTNDYENAKFAVQHHVSETDEEVLVISENLPEELLQIDEDPDDQPSTSAKIVEELRLKALKNNKSDVAELTVSVYEETINDIQQIHVKNMDEPQKSENNKQKSEENEQKSEKNKAVPEEYKQTDENKHKSEQYYQNEQISEKNKQKSDEDTKRGEKKKPLLQDEKNSDKQFEEDIKQQNTEEYENCKEEKSNVLLDEKKKELKEDVKQQIDINVNKKECSEANTQSLEPNIPSNKQKIISDNPRIADKHKNEKLGSEASRNNYTEDSLTGKNESVKSSDCVPKVIENAIKLTASDSQGQQSALTSNATQKEQSDLRPILEPNETNVLINSSKIELILNIGQSCETTMPLQTQQDEKYATVTSIVSTPKRSNVRGTSVPPQSISDAQNSTPLDVNTTPERKTVRGKSVPPQSLVVEAISISATPIESVVTPLRRNATAPPEDSSVSATPLVTTPKRRNIRGTSILPKNQIQELSSVSPLPTLHTPRAPRARSVQPKSTLSSEEAQETGTPIQVRRNTHGTSVPSTTGEQISPKVNQNLRGTSVPPVDATVKIATRRRSILLDSINEDQTVADSPSTRTRSRARLSSLESELDTPTEEQQPLGKRSRKTSNSSSVSEQLSSTSKRLRRNSVTSQPDISTPRTTRARSAVLVQEDSNEQQIAAKGTPKRLAMKRKKSADNTPVIKEASEEEITETMANDSNLDEEAIITKDKRKLPSAKKEAAAEAPSSYSLSRRLTRTQLAMLEKSAKVTAIDLNLRTTPSPPKRISTRRTSRSTVSVHDSDDAESIASHRSNYSSSAVNRRVTRSSVKDKEEIDEELTSNASSISSEKLEKHRSKGFKGSPGTLLTAIPEDDSSESSGQKKRTRTTKH